MRDFLRLVLGGAAAVTLFSGGVASAEQSSEVGIQHYSCGSSRPPNLDAQGAGGAWPTAEIDLGARSGSATSCSITGLVLDNDRLDYYCHTWGADDQRWTYVSAFDWGVAGWVPYTKLYPRSQASCPK
ncbi:hypothetical protein [Amycolatopsis magusensis]|uniref:hypothetical protein n=1 Tax=Amycolatopsis magusensis TaxID=882444 RepID=UPI00379BF794